MLDQRLHDWPAPLTHISVAPAPEVTLVGRPAPLSALSALRAIFAYRWLVLLFVALFVCLGIVYLHNATYKYTVMLHVAPNAPDTNGLLSKLGGLASVAGISLPTDKGASPFDMYVEEIKAPDTAVSLARDTDVMHVVFADQWSSSDRRWHPPTSFGYGLARGVKSLIGLPVMPWHPPGGPELGDFIDRRVVLVRDSKKAVATLQLEHQDPRFAARFLSDLHTVIDSSLRQRAMTRSRDYIAYLTNKLAVIQVGEHRQALANALGGEERTLMLASAHGSYAADPFGGVSVSLTPTSPKVGVVLGLAAVVGLLVGAAVAIIRNYSRTRTDLI